MVKNNSKSQNSTKVQSGNSTGNLDDDVLTLGDELGSKLDDPLELETGATELYDDDEYPGQGDLEDFAPPDGEDDELNEMSDKLNLDEEDSEF